MWNNNLDAVTAFAPATVGNVAVGFDMMGFALDDIGDYVTLTRRDDDQIVIEPIGAQIDTPLDPWLNCATVPICHYLQDQQSAQGFTVKLAKGMPLSAGMGGSAASAVAGVIALNAMLSKPMPSAEIIHYALLGEEMATGVAHADNVMPSLVGGLCVLYGGPRWQHVSLPTLGLQAVVVHPHLQLATRAAREAIPKHLPLNDIVQQTSHLAITLIGLYQQDDNLLQQGWQDSLIEPHRASFIPGFFDAKEAALDHGALAFSIAGAGPSVFAIAKDRPTAESIGKAIQRCFMREKYDSDYWLSTLQAPGAAIIHTEGSE